MKFGQIIHKYLDENRQRKTKPAFIWWERFGLLVFALCIYDSVVGFDTPEYVSATFYLSWILTGIALLDFVWFAYKNRRC